MATLKTCFKCNAEKPLTEFYRHAQMGDGHLNKCKECTKRDVREHRLLNLAQFRAYDRRRASQPHRVTARMVYQQTDAYKIASAKAHAKQKLKAPHKVSATVAVNNAVRDGRLFKEPCFVCGDADAQAHHSHYGEPLMVTWLCRKHHAELHKEFRAYLRDAA